MSTAGKIVLKFLRVFPYVRNLEKNVGFFEKSCGFPPGHYYSPIVDSDEYYKQQQLPFSSAEYIPVEIDFNESAQFELLKAFDSYYDEMPFTDHAKDGLRYYFDNDFFTNADAITLYLMLRHFKPKRIIEIGSGFSSALILDTNAVFLEGSTDLTFIDPNPERLINLLHPNEKVNLLKQKIQDVDLKVFSKLEAGDFLLIDTSHVSKSGSDVNYIYFNILPMLNVGVKIHIHDVFFPFEYPEKWVVEERRGWNELYLLRAFLAYNKEFQMIFFNEYLANKYPSLIKEKMPRFVKPASTVTGGIWIERV
jgi:hypothetical protein